MTVAETIARARKALLAAGVPADEAPGDAEILARHALGWDLTQLALRRNDTVPARFEQAFGALIARRASREPVSQILGHREFWGLDFEVTRDVLTPRPETELVVQAALDLCAWADAPTKPLIMDVGTGSGCIAIALATELPDARFIASDTSAAALTVARRNAARHGVTGRIAFRHTSLIPSDAAADIIASNPPYIPLGDRPSLAPEVREYEPELALFGGEDGLDFHRRLFETAASGGLGVDGKMIVEVGYDQAARVKALAAPRIWSFERGYHDLQGIERVLVFKVRNR